MIFRKHIIILLAFFLLVSNLGLAFNVHYCGDKIDSLSLHTISSAEKTIDECCGIDEKDFKCCNDKIIKAEIKSDQIIVKSLLYDFDFLATNTHWKPIIFASNFNFNQSDDSTYCFDDNSPPLYVLFSQYTFYC